MKPTLLLGAFCCAVTTLTAITLAADSAPPPAIVQQAFLKASNPDTDDRFGGALAISGDTVVIGGGVNGGGEDSNATGVNGDQSDNSASNSGAAYVFVRSGSNWTQQAYLKASNTAANHRFGYSVAIDGDTIVIGSRSEYGNSAGVNGDQSDQSLPGAGAAYVFVRDGTNWTQQAYLKASNPGYLARFGHSVSIDQDTIIVGSTYEDSSSSGVNGQQEDDGVYGSGAAYIFVRNGTNWSQQAYLKAIVPKTNDNFGDVVTISGNTVVVGAKFEGSASAGINGDPSDYSAQWAGAAYVYVREGTNWAYQAYLKASNAKEADFFAASVTISGETIVVGAPWEDSDASGINGEQTNNRAPLSGAAYVFVREGTNWSQQAYLKASRTRSGNNFGESVSLIGNVLAVGATGEQKVYLFGRISTNWSERTIVQRITANPFGADYDWFGSRVALSGDSLLVGAQEEDSSAAGVNGDETNNDLFNPGAAFVFTGIDSLKPLPSSLGISPMNDSVRLSWNSVSGNYILDESFSMRGTTNFWSPVSGSFQTNGAEISITLPRTNVLHFFRLRNP